MGIESAVARAQSDDLKLLPPVKEVEVTPLSVLPWGCSDRVISSWKVTRTVVLLSSFGCKFDPAEVFFTYVVLTQFTQKTYFFVVVVSSLLFLSLYLSFFFSFFFFSFSSSSCFPFLSSNVSSSGPGHVSLLFANEEQTEAGS